MNDGLNSTTMATMSKLRKLELIDKRDIEIEALISKSDVVKAKVFSEAERTANNSIKSKIWTGNTASETKMHIQHQRILPK